MSRNSVSGAYSMPSNTFNPAADGVVLNTSDWNTTKADIETALSYTYGTGTPTLGDGTNNFTLTTATIAYSQIGNVVFWNVNCTWSSIGSAGAAQLRISGLPVSCAGLGAFQFSTMDGMNMVSNVNGKNFFLTGSYGAGTTVLSFRQSEDNVASAIYPANTCSATGKIIGGGFYFA